MNENWLRVANLQLMLDHVKDGFYSLNTNLSDRTQGQKRNTNMNKMVRDRSVLLAAVLSGHRCLPSNDCMRDTEVET